MNSSKILYSLKLNEKFQLCLWKIPKLQRTYLSKAYTSPLNWNKRFDDELIKKVNFNHLLFELNDKIDNKKIISALDVDFFVNSLKNIDYTDNVANVLYKLRLSKETTNTLDSTHHAVVRYFIDIGKTEELIAILNDRLNYGIFCDYFCYNLLMDYFIKKQNFGAAAKIATLMMLQEEFENPISNSLAIYSCHNYLKNPDTWQEVDPETLKEEPEEEIKIRVKYIRNPYFDDHFDLWKPSDLVGKTLFWIGQTMDNPLGRSCELRGSILYRKYAEAIFLLETWKNNGIQEIIYKDTLSLIKTDVPEIFSETATELEKKLQLLLAELESADLCKKNLDEDITNLVKNAVEIHSDTDILEQNKIYNIWCQERAKVLEQELHKLKNQERLANVKELKENLIKEERILTFFDNQELIELQISEKLEKEKRLYGEDPTLKRYKEYVPPELVKETLDKP